jgi:O6-methylguanine-DNA--protein-cysteine methyltransferase
MAKLKYYYLAEKNGFFKKLVSPDSSIISNMILDGYNFYGFDDESDIPINPILDNGEVREMTEAEIEAAATAVKLARTVFTKLEIREAFKSLNNEAALDALLDGNADFKTYWQEAQEIDLGHAVTVQALANFTEAEINALKLAV